MPDAKDRLGQLHEAAKALLSQNKDIAENHAEVVELPGENGATIKGTQIAADHREQFDTNMAKLREVKAEVERIKELTFMEAWGATPDEQSVALEIMSKGAGTAQTFENKSIGQQLISSEQWKNFKDSTAFPRSMELDYPLSLGRKDVYSTLPSGTPSRLGSVQRDPMVLLPHRTVRIRDLFPVTRTTAATIEYFKVTGFANAASTVPERTAGAFTLKPQSGLSIQGSTTNTRTIAHWEVASRNVLDDEPQIQSIIENELLYGLQLTEDSQILSGTGTGEDLLGLLVTPGIQTYAASSESVAGSPNKNIDAVRHAMTMTYISNYEATGIIMGPQEWEEIEKVKDTTLRYILNAPPAANAPPTLWGLPVVVTPAMPDDKVLVGAFGLAVQLYDRMNSTVRIAEQHSDFFVRNAIVILCEERLALATKRPEGLVLITFE